MLRDLNQSYPGGMRRLGLTTTGIRGDLIPSAGGSMPPWMYASLVLPADAAKEYAYWILSHNFPFGLPLDDYSAGTIAGLPDGTYVATLFLEEFGVRLAPDFTGTLVVGTPPDGTAPTLSGTIGITDNTTGTSYTATCPAGADNVAVTQYRWRLNGGGWTVIPSGSRVASITGRTSGTTDALDMAAGDAAGNWSTPLSASVVLPDVLGPTLAGTISVSSITSSGFMATCPVATDNVGVVGYQHRLDGGAWTDIAAGGRSVTYTGLVPESTHQLDMRAKDAAPNYSAPLTASVTLLAAGALPPPSSAMPEDTLKAPQDQILVVGGFAPKDPRQVKTIAFEFKRYAQNVSAPVVTVVRERGTADASPDGVKFGAPSVVGSTVYQRVRAGVDLCDYTVICEVDTPAGDHLVMAGRLPVRMIP